MTTLGIYVPREAIFMARPVLVRRRSPESDFHRFFIQLSSVVLLRPQTIRLTSLPPHGDVREG